MTNSALPSNSIADITINGTMVWVECYRYQENGGVAKFNGATWQAWTTANSPLPHKQVEAVELDRLGNVWISTASQGIAVFKEGGVSSGNELILNLTALIEGFYNVSLDKMTSDTMKVYLRNTSSPYTIVDSAKALVDSAGNGKFYFANALNGVSYYIAIKHRNSIETWSGSGVSFSSNQLSYDFTTLSSQAYGNNLTLKGNKFTIYSGDVNQDGIVDASDMSLVDNDAFNQTTGYSTTDVNGDHIVDASDLSLVDNNSLIL